MRCSGFAPEWLLPEGAVRLGGSSGCSRADVLMTVIVDEFVYVNSAREMPAPGQLAPVLRQIVQAVAPGCIRALELKIVRAGENTALIAR